VAVTGPGGEKATTDMPAGVGGTATVPSPGWLFRAAAAACVASLIGIRAAMSGIRLESADVTVDSESDDRGILGLDSTIPAGALAMKIVARVRADGLSMDATEALIRWAVDHCPVTDTVQRAVPIELVVE
jgi:uncharacterized OsmC-like protein